MKKTIILFFLLLALARSATAQSQFFTCSTNADGTLTITGYTGPGGSVTLPTNINGLTVSSVTNFALFNKFNVTSLTIPGTITNFGYAAFAGLLNMTNLTIGYGITSIVEGMFQSAESLTNLFIPFSVTNIGSGAFNTCTKMASVSIPNSVTTIGDSAFGDSGLCNVTVPNSVTNIGNGVFEVCPLTNFTFSNSVIGTNMFANCNNLTNVVIPTNITNIGDGAFYECGNLANITLPANGGDIGNEAFSGCSSLTSIIFSDNIGSVGEYAFQDCASLANLTIPASVTNIGSYAFEDSGLRNVSILGNANIGGYAFQGVPLASIYIAGGVVGDYACQFCTNLTNLSLGNGVLSFGLAAFQGDPLNSLVVPDGVTNIGQGAFAECDLTNLVVSSTNVTIGGYAFYENPLTTVTLSGVVNIMGDQVFWGCMNLTNAVIGPAVWSLSFGMFTGCYSLTNVLCLGNAPDIGGSYPSDGAVFRADTNVTIYYLPGTTGWGPTYGGFESYPGAPTALWNPAIQTADGSFGVNNNGQFGFNITGTPNIPVAIMACTNLANPVWTPVQSLTLTNGQAYFSDPQSSNSPARYYGLGFP